MPRQPEGRIVARIKDYLAKQGACSFKIQGSEESFQEVGIPDLLVCYRGRFIGIEVKMPGEEPTPKQLAVLRRIERAGGIALVAYSVLDVQRALSKLETKR